MEHSNKRNEIVSKFLDEEQSKKLDTIESCLEFKKACELSKKMTVEKLINEKATWNSFSGSLTKIENDLLEVPSIRGDRYFGPSKTVSYTHLTLPTKA